MAKKTKSASPMTPDRSNRIKDMLSSRNTIERDNSPMMKAVNKMRMAKGKKA